MKDNYSDPTSSPRAELAENPNYERLFPEESEHKESSNSVEPTKQVHSGRNID
jgi:hypothetical protein